MGIHIAAPALTFGRGNALEAIARERLSTVYFPGGKITMLPDEAVDRATLAAGRTVPTLSLYLRVDATSMEILSTESRVERITVADNLRLAELDTRLNEDAVAQGRVEGPHGDDLFALWKLAKFLKAARGAGEEKNLRLDYTFRVTEGRVAIEPRRRGSPVDMLVAELMIHVNSTWGKLLAERGYDALYRNQKGAKTRMEVAPGTHEWLGVSHYAWTSSPLRRFSDLANQRQLIAMLGGSEPAYTREELAAAGAGLRGHLRGLCRAPAAARALLVPALPPAGGHRERRCDRDPRRAGAHRRAAAGVPRRGAADRRPPGSGCAFPSAKWTCGKPTYWPATRGNDLEFRLMSRPEREP